MIAEQFHYSGIVVLLFALGTPLLSHLPIRQKRAGGFYKPSRPKGVGTQQDHTSARSFENTTGGQYCTRACANSLGDRFCADPHMLKPVSGIAAADSGVAHCWRHILMYSRAPHLNACETP